VQFVPREGQERATNESRMWDEMEAADEAGNDAKADFLWQQINMLRAPRLTEAQNTANIVAASQGNPVPFQTPAFKLPPRPSKRNPQAPPPAAGKPAAAPGADKYQVGAIYRDKNGNRAKYLGNGQWGTP
jgi:hypothetical protein